MELDKFQFVEIGKIEFEDLIYDKGIYIASFYAGYI